MAEVVVSLMSSKNLSQSMLITRNLYTTLQIGSDQHRSTQVEVDEAVFSLSSTVDPLIITLRNGQTQTVMYVRNVPLTLVTGNQNTMVLYVAVHPPGDPRNLTFEEGPPRPDAPQVHISLRYRPTPGAWGSMQSPAAIQRGPSIAHEDRFEDRRRDQLDTAFPPAPIVSEPRPSQLDRESLTIRELERQAKDIKNKFSAADAQRRQAQSTEEQLQDAFRNIEEMRRKVEAAEEELSQLSVQRNTLEHEKQTAREGCARSRETLRLRELSIMELKSSRDESDRQLSQAKAEADRQRQQMEQSHACFTDGIKSLSEELERWRADSQGLADALSRQDKRVEELNQQSGQATTAGASSEELRALQKQYEEALSELDSVRADSSAEEAKALQAEEQARHAKLKLAETEAAARQAREMLAQQVASDEIQRKASQADVSELDTTDRDLVAVVGKEAQLEGQIGENRIQLQEMELRMKEFVDQVAQRQSQAQDLEGTISCLQNKFDIEVRDGSQFEIEEVEQLKDKVAEMQAQTDSFHQKTRELESTHREVELEHTRRVGDLESSRRLVDAELGSAKGEIAKLRDNRERLASSSTAAESDAQTSGAELDQIQALAYEKEQKLTDTITQRAQREKERGESARKLADMQVELEEARRQLAEADGSAEQLRSMADARQTSRIAKEKEVEGKVEQLRAELENRKLDQLRVAEQTVRQERERLRAAIQENRSAVVQQAELVKRLQEKRLKQQEELGAASVDSEGGQARQLELRKVTGDGKAAHQEKTKLIRGEIGELQGKQAAASTELGIVVAERLELDRQVSEVSSECAQLEDRLSATSMECQASLSSNAQRLQEMQEECARYEAEETELNRRGAELEARFSELETKVNEDQTKHVKLEADLSSQRRQLGNAKAELELCDGDIVRTKVQHAAEMANLAQLQQESSVQEVKAAQLRSKLITAEATSARACVLRTELEACRKSQQERGENLQSHESQLEQSRKALEEANSNILAAKNVELDCRVDRIQNLEREVKSLTSALDNTRTSRGQLADQVSTAEAKQHQARTEVMEQEARVGVLRQELQVLEMLKGNFEGKVGSAQARLKVAEDTVALAEKDARDRSSQLGELSAMAARAAEDHETRVKGVRADVGAQEMQNTASASVLMEQRNISRALRETMEASKRHVQEFQTRYDILGSTLSQVQLDQQAAEAERRVANDQAAQQLQALNALEQELRQLESTQDCSSQEEQSVGLFREQLTSRQEQKRAAEEEARDYDNIQVTYNNELIQLEDERSKIGSEWVDKVEDSNQQFSSIEQLEENIRSLKFESELLNFGLHDAVQFIDFLQKENHLMKQQVEGLYEGTLQDWWAEVHRIKVLAEVERHKDEVGQWTSFAKEAEEDLIIEVDIMRKKNFDVEQGWRSKLEALEDNFMAMKSKSKELDAQVGDSHLTEASGSVHSVPAALHGLVSPQRPLPQQHQRRKALVIGCNYTRSHKPLQGCSNDVWNVQCLLRHSLQYSEDKVRCFIDGSDFCPSPPSRQPTRANILDGIQWLTSNVSPGDNLFLYFSGYGTQQPQAEGGGMGEMHEAFLVPSDFADELPASFFQYPGRPLPRLGQNSPTYRLVPLVEISNALLRLPPMCKVTMVFDCCHSVVPNISAKNPAPPAFRRVAVESTAHVPRSTGVLGSQPRYLELPPLLVPSTRVLPGAPVCNCHCYSACQGEQWCAEFPIEGCVQGAFTWTFVKALTAGHLHTTVQQHGKALHSILAELRYHFRWINQSPVIQLSSSAKLQDYVLLP